jgi:hypothetical protein
MLTEGSLAVNLPSDWVPRDLKEFWNREQTNVNCLEAYTSPRAQDFRTQHSRNQRSQSTITSTGELIFYKRRACNPFDVVALGSR